MKSALFLIKIPWGSFLKHSLTIELVKGQNKFYAWLNTSIKSNSTYTSFKTCENKKNDIPRRFKFCSNTWAICASLRLVDIQYQGMCSYWKTNTLSKSLYVNKTCVNTQTTQSKCISKYDHLVGFSIFVKTS